MFISGFHFSQWQHHFNSLHIYSRLVEMGVPKKPARKITRWYELLTRKIIYGRR